MNLSLGMSNMAVDHHRWLVGWLVEFWCTHSCYLAPLINLVKCASPTRKVFLKGQIKLLVVVCYRILIFEKSVKAINMKRKYGLSLGL